MVCIYEVTNQSQYKYLRFCLMNALLCELAHLKDQNEIQFMLLLFKKEKMAIFKSVNRRPNYWQYLSFNLRNGRVWEQQKMMIDKCGVSEHIIRSVKIYKQIEAAFIKMIKEMFPNVQYIFDTPAEILMIYMIQLKQLIFIFACQLFLKLPSFAFIVAQADQIRQHSKAQMQYSMLESSICAAQMYFINMQNAINLNICSYKLQGINRSAALFNKTENKTNENGHENIGNSQYGPKGVRISCEGI